MEKLDRYFELQKEICDYFGYKEDWVVIPLNDCTGYFWKIIGGGAFGGSVRFAEALEDISNDETCYEDEIYTQRFLPRWVYRGEDYTMICVDTHVDGNKFLSIFSNKKEVK